MARVIVAAIVMLLAASRPVHADDFTARLAFAGDACDREAIEHRVRELAQRDPFDPAAAWVVDVRIEQRGDDVTAAVRLLDPHGIARGERPVEAKSCAALSASPPQAVVGNIGIWGLAISGETVIATGALQYGADFGTGLIQDHGSSLDANGTWHPGMGDAFVVAYDWVAD